MAVYSPQTDAAFTEEQKLLKEQTQVEDAFVYRIYQNGSNQVNRYMMQHASMAYEDAYFQYDTYMSCLLYTSETKGRILRISEDRYEEVQYCK